MVRSGVAFVAVAALVLSGCGGDEPSAGPGGKLTFTRPDGSTFSLVAGEVSCGPSRADARRRALMVRSSPWPTEDRWENSDRFELEAILDDVSSGATFTLPHSYVYNDAHGASMFAVDHETKNELNSDQEEAHGTIVVKRASCEPEIMIEVTVDATLGSEFGNGEDVAVKGSFTLHG